MLFNITVADKNFEIDSQYQRVAKLCEQYISDANQSSIKIETTKEDIDKEKLKAIEDAKKNHPGNVHMNVTYLETLVIYRKIAETMLDYETFLMHGSVIATDDKHCYMFTAKSGTGKTTHTKLWLDNLSSAYVVNGDKPLLKVDSSQVFVCGTPWCGKERWNTNCIVPLKGICILERANENSIEEISFKEAFPALLAQSYRPDDVEKFKKTLNLIYGLNGKVKFYRMQVNNFADDAFSTSYNAMVKNEI